jgi:hypothetical protein
MELEGLLLEDGFLDALQLCGYLQHGKVASTRSELTRVMHADRTWQSNKDVVSPDLRAELDRVHPKGVLQLVVKGQFNRTAFIVSAKQQQIDEVAKILVHAGCPETAALIKEYYAKTHAETTPSVRNAWSLFRSNPKARYPPIFV